MTYSTSKPTKLSLARDRNWRIHQIKGSCAILRQLARELHLFVICETLLELEPDLLKANDERWQVNKTKL